VHIIIPALTYDGSVFDTALNAVVLVILITALVLQSRSPWWITFVTMAVLQVVLWFALEATGISVVWSGLAGAALVDLVVGRLPDRGASAPSRRWMLATAVTVSIAAITFYVVALPPLSTVAHLLALMVGAGLHTLIRRSSRRCAAKKTEDFRNTPEGSVPLRLPERLHRSMLEKWSEYHEFDDRLYYGNFGEVGLLITRDKDGYRVDRRADRSNYYDQFRFRTTSFRELKRRLLQE
jgi:hypothetical protein